MSQAKVDRYKEEKKNRQKLMKKEKRHERILKLCGLAVAVVAVVWIGYSGYNSIISNGESEGKTYAVDVAALDDFMNNLPGEDAE